jgi:hypothetical protein
MSSVYMQTAAQQDHRDQPRHGQARTKLYVRDTAQALNRQRVANNLLSGISTRDCSHSIIFAGARSYAPCLLVCEVHDCMHLGEHGNNAKCRIATAGDHFPYERLHARLFTKQYVCTDP